MLLLLRAGLSSFTSTAWYLSWRHMRLADTYALGFTAPLIMTLLAIPMLKERIRWRRLLSTLIGFSGVLIMLRPSGGLWTPALPLLIAGIVAMTVTRIMARQLSLTETPECQAFWLMVSHAVAGLLLLALYPPGITGASGVWMALAFLGISSGLGQCVFSFAYGLAPVSALAPYESLSGHIPRSSLRSSDLLPFCHQYPAACRGDFYCARGACHCGSGCPAALAPPR